jgi:DNA-binding MurR/RpiR family transcriptional regulator
MAEQGRKIEESARRQIERLREVMTVREAARQAGVNKSTVVKYTKKSGR